MKIIRDIYAFFIVFFISNVLYASDQCNVEDNLAKVNSMILESVTSELSDYFLRRDLVFPSFSITYFKSEAKWGYDLITKGLSKQEILELQRKRYFNIYSKINQKFRNEYLKDTKTKSLVKNIDSQFRIIPKYEKLLNPLIQRQLQSYNQDLLLKIEGKALSSEITLSDVMAEEQAIIAIVNDNFKFTPDAVQIIKKNKNKDSEVSVCKMKFKNNKINELELEYMIVQFENDPEKLTHITALINQEKIRSTTDFGYYFIQFYDFE